MAAIVAETTAERIREMLFSGTWQPGDKLPSESKLGEELGVGRSSVREGLRLLAAQGYVEIIPNRGAFAAATSEDELPSPRSWLEMNRDMVAELLSVRTCIEPFAAALCAEKITPEGMKTLKKLLDAYEEAMDTRDPELLSRLDLDFHRTILTEAHNRYLCEMYQPLLEGFMQYSRRSMAATLPQSNTYAEHLSVYNAIAARAPEEAEAAMYLHICIAKRRIRAAVE